MEMPLLWEGAAKRSGLYAHQRIHEHRGPQMAQLVVSWLICSGRIRVHAINAIGQRKGRIVEVEEVETGERVHGSPRRLERLVQRLRQSSGELDQVPAWTPDTTS